MFFVVVVVRVVDAIFRYDDLPGFSAVVERFLLHQFEKQNGFHSSEQVNSSTNMNVPMPVCNRSEEQFLANRTHQ